jgi:hypothetical protein
MDPTSIFTAFAPGQMETHAGNHRKLLNHLVLYFTLAMKQSTLPPELFKTGQIIPQAVFDSGLLQYWYCSKRRYYSNTDGTVATRRPKTV